MEKRFSTEIILEALCYSLEQAYSSEIEITRTVDSDEDRNFMLRELAEEIVFTIEEWGVDEVMLEDIRWFNKDLIVEILSK